MSFPYYYPVVPNSYVESPMFVNGNQEVGYKWYQSSPSSDVMAASPCLCGCQSSIPQTQVGAPNPYFTHECEPPPVPLSFIHTSQGSDSQLLNENRNNYSAYKVFAENPISPTQVYHSPASPSPYIYTPPFTLPCHTTLSTGQPYYALESTAPVTATTTIVDSPKLMDTPPTDNAVTTSTTSVKGNQWEETLTKIIAIIDKMKDNWAVRSTVDDKTIQDDVVMGDGSTLVETVVEVQNEVVVDAVEVKPQVFDKSPVRNSNLVVKNMCEEGLRNADDSIIRMDLTIFQNFSSITEYVKEFMRIKSRDEFKFKCDFEDPLLASCFVEGLDEDIREALELWAPQTLQEAIYLAMFQELLIDESLWVENIVRKSYERLVEDRLFVDKYGVEIDNVILAVDTVGNKESRDESGKEDGVADEERVLVPVEGAEKYFTAQCELEELINCLRNSELTVWESRPIMHYCAKVGDELPSSGKPHWVPLNAIEVDNKKETLKNVREYITDLVVQLNKVLALRIVNEDGEIFCYKLHEDERGKVLTEVCRTSGSLMMEKQLHCHYIPPDFLFNTVLVRVMMSKYGRRNNSWERVRDQSNGSWSLLCPNAVPSLADCWGHKFENLYTQSERECKATKNCERLSFLYLITGTTAKLSKLLAGVKNDVMGQSHTAFYLGDVQERVKLLENILGDVGWNAIIVIFDPGGEVLELIYERLDAMGTNGCSSVTSRVVSALREHWRVLTELALLFLQRGVFLENCKQNFQYLLIDIKRRSMEYLLSGIWFLLGIRSAIILVFDPGGHRNYFDLPFKNILVCKGVLQHSGSSLRTRMLLRRMDCNGPIMGLLLLVQQLGQVISPLGKPKFNTC